MKAMNSTLVERLSFIMRLCQGKEVLNLGCGDSTRLEYATQLGHHLHIELSKVAKRLVGIDINQHALDRLLQYLPPGSELIAHDVEQLGAMGDIGKFDVIVCGELIEHLSNPGAMLDGVRNLLKNDGKIIITTPNVLSLKFFLHAALFGKDPSSDFHTVAFTPNTLSQLLIRHGFVEPTLYFSKWILPSLRSRIFSLATGPISQIRPYLADTIIAVSKPSKNEV
jgi:2-polyprenyl-3-methyl-5-hydroxy-6-metoxy-1,4-benzoquinol methylase